MSDSNLAADMAPKSLPVEDDNDGSQARSSQADKLVEFTCERVELLHDENRDCYARDSITGEVRRLESRAFKDWLAAGFYAEEQKSIRGQSQAEALATLSAKARFEGEPHKVHLRCAGEQGEYFLDLAEPGRSRAVKWSQYGWQVVDSPEVLFVRGDAMQSLPEPVRGGSLSALRDMCNVPEQERPLVLAWLIDAIRPDTPYPGLELTGFQGSGKSTTAEALRRIIDPNACNLRGAPKATEDLFVTAGVNHVVAYENLSHIPAPMQDALCILSTGGGYAKRKLYSDSDESVINVRRPWLLNAICAVVTQQDLLDRTVCVECPVIEHREQSAVQRKVFEDALPGILGALFDLAVSALKALPRIQIGYDERPRMIEYAMLGMAVTDVLYEDPQMFLTTLQGNRRASVERTIESSPVCTAVIDLVADAGSVTATAKDLLDRLSRYKPSGCDSWPRSAKGLGDALRRAAPALKHLDIECVPEGKINGNYHWTIERKLRRASPTSPKVLTVASESRTSGHSGHALHKYSL